MGIWLIGPFRLEEKIFFIAAAIRKTLSYSNSFIVVVIQHVKMPTLNEKFIYLFCILLSYSWLWAGFTHGSLARDYYWRDLEDRCMYGKNQTSMTIQKASRVKYVLYLQSSYVSNLLCRTNSGPIGLQ